jgi:riboflavin synthase|tara:strand:+ start:1141 stop:1725 length:585 start_codon:yes stop_codon:yes gene_type:complete
MFNGIIKNTGKINKIYKQGNNCVIEILSNMKFKKKEIGSSVSCSGACLTIEKFKKNIVNFYISRETLKRTTFSTLKKGDVVNLEKSIKYGDRLSGHFVQGHVDTAAIVRNISFVGRSWLIRFSFPNKFKKFIVEKGSISINGVSLTVAKIIKNGFQVAIIPLTLKKTNLIMLKKNDPVNIEFDVLGKYIKNFIK